MPILETQRVTLRHLALKDTNTLYKIFSNAQIMQFYRAPKSLAETKAWIQKYQTSYEKYDFGKWAVVDKKSNQCIGAAGLSYQVEVDGVDEVELGYLLDSEYWGKGLASEISKTIIQYAKNSLGIYRLISITHPENTAARRVCEKIGMSFEKEIMRWNQTCVVYAINEKEYESI